MAYDNFTKEQLFTDSNVNILCNRIYNALEAKFTKVTLDASFAITGTVAKIIQGAALSPIEVIPFITNSQTVFDYCAKELPVLLKARAVVFKNRVQLDYNGVFLEVWLTNDVKTINEVAAFFVQDTADIPTNIK
jgi:hypothetical protein